MKLPYRIDAPTDVVESRYYKEADPAISRTFRDDNEQLYGYISLRQDNKFLEFGESGCHILELSFKDNINYETIYNCLDISLYDIWVNMKPNVFKYHWAHKDEKNSDILKQFFIDCDFGEFIEKENCYILLLDYVSHD